jgi:exodeoxyribonuclease V alpha subunit
MAGPRGERGESQNDPIERLIGVIERVLFHNQENGFSVLGVKSAQQSELAIVVGPATSPAPGEQIDAEGRWVVDREHGLQFKADQVRTATPVSLEGIERFLGSGAIKGIGRSLASKIVGMFGERTLEVLDSSPSFLLDIPGVGKKKLKMIRASWHEQRNVRAIMLFLHEHGIGSSRAVRIYRMYGEQAVKLIRENPYRLADDVRGIGFRSADQIAGRLGLAPESPERIHAGLRFALSELTANGHVGFPEAGVIQRTSELLRLAPNRVGDELEPEVKSQRLVRERVGESDWLFLSALRAAEHGVADSIRRINSTGGTPFPPVKNLDDAINGVEAVKRVRLAPEQREAIRLVCNNHFVVVTGGPGVGKTTLVRCLIELFSSKDLKCVLAAPTGRAAKRMAEATGRSAVTIHRLLEYDAVSGGFVKGREHPLRGDLFVFDEASMIDCVLADHLLRAIPNGAAVVFVGDVDQLPSVGPGTVLADVIESQSVPVVRLTHIFRQDEGSRIVAAAHAIHGGKLPEPTPDGPLGDFYFLEVDDPATVEERVLRLVKERIPARFGVNPMTDVQVLAPMHRGSLGARRLNEVLQETLNPKAPGPIAERFGWTYRVGDRVLQTINNYERDVFNGDLGVIRRIDEEEQELAVDFDGRLVEYDFGELDEISLAYCLTIHKSQGSEYPCVVVALHTQHFPLLQRNLVYTAVTRGRKLVVVVGSRRALQLAVSRRDAGKRMTALVQRLRGEL